MYLHLTTPHYTINVLGTVFSIINRLNLPYFTSHKNRYTVVLLRMSLPQHSFFDHNTIIIYRCLHHNMVH